MRELFNVLPPFLLALGMVGFLVAMGLAIERMFSLNDWRLLLIMVAVGTCAICAIFVGGVT